MTTNQTPIDSAQPAAPARRRDRVLEVIAVYKFVKATLLTALGLGALQLIRYDLSEQARMLFDMLGSSVDVVPVLRVLRDLRALGPEQLRLVGAGAFLYAGLFLTEGIGLWRERRWAEYLTVVATASFIPFEVFELSQRITWPRIGALVANGAVVLYLIYRLRHPWNWQIAGARDT
ncbi:MAG: DUF2127 domain-containing protein [Gemmatimonadales bacterium]